MKTTISFTGRGDGRHDVVVDSGDGPVTVQESVAQELADDFLSIRNTRHANLQVGKNAKITWKGAGHVSGKNDHGRMVIACERCMTLEELSLPLTVGQFHDRFQPFAHQHKSCEV